MEPQGVKRELLVIFAAGSSRVMAAAEKVTLNTLTALKIINRLIVVHARRVAYTTRPKKVARAAILCNALFAVIAIASVLAVWSCADLPAPAEPPQKPEASEHYSKGTAYLRAAKYDLAIRELKHSVQIEPTSAFAHLNLGIAYYFRGCEYNRTVASLHRSVKLGGDDHGLTRFQLANALYAGKRFRDAAREYETAEAIRQRDPSVVFRYLAEAKAVDVVGHELVPPIDNRSFNPAFFLRVLSLMRSGETNEAQTLLASRDSGWWFGLSELGQMVADYLAGILTEEQLLSKNLKNKGIISFVYLVIGVNNIVKHNLAKSEEVLQELIDKNKHTSFYNSWARVNLDHIRGRDESRC